MRGHSVDENELKKSNVHAPADYHCGTRHEYRDFT